MEIRKELLPAGKLKKVSDDPLSLPFGKTFTDYMFLMDYSEDKKWHDARIVPYGPLSLDPAAIVFHYSQEVFEGMKAFVSPEQDILLFRPTENAKRMNRSLSRLCMPEIPEEDFMAGLKELVRLEKRWIPAAKGSALYIRPFVIATEPGLGVRSSKEYVFSVILSPVGPYYATGFNPVSLYVTSKYVRACKGGTGEAKVGGNYAASLLAGHEAVEHKCNQVLWLDATHEYIEEVGSMNIFFIIGKELVTPNLTGSILPGITRKSLLKLADDFGLKPVERPIAIDELIAKIEKGELTESFGAGTAAVISPVGKIVLNEKEYVINNNETGPYAKRFFDELTGIQYGLVEDRYNWVMKI